MSMTSDGGPAFPTRGKGIVSTCPNTGNRIIETEDPLGMSLRDWFAGQALSGLLSDPNMSMESALEIALQVADAMLAERKKESEA